MKRPTLQENLIYQRKLKGYTQDELAERTTVGVRTIQRIEKGEVQPHLQTIKLIAVGLGVEVEDLIVLDDPKEEPVDRKWMFLLHASPFFGLIIPLANILFPLFIWINKSADNTTYDEHGRAVINFHCTLSLLFLATLLLFFAFPGYNYILTGIVFLIGIIISIKNIFTALETGKCSYPFSIPFLKPKA